MCHPERSEGSQVFGKTRFFAVLRMTILVFQDFFSSLLDRITEFTGSTILIGSHPVNPVKKEAL
jgi:hypothetical protein